MNFRYVYIYQPNTLSKRFSRSRNVTKQSVTNESDRVSICSCNQVVTISPIFYLDPRTPFLSSFSPFHSSLPFHPPPIPHFLSCIGANRLTGDFDLTRSISHDLPENLRDERNQIGSSSISKRDEI